MSKQPSREDNEKLVRQLAQWVKEACYEVIKKSGKAAGEAEAKAFYKPEAEEGASNE
jgi:hypothetical protein